MIRIKRIYLPISQADGACFLVDGLWPRGIKKESIQQIPWLREVAPSRKLREWYHHDLELWEEFFRRYSAELENNPPAWQPLLEAARRGNITLLYAARDTEHNNAAALKRFLDEKIDAGS